MTRANPAVTLPSGISTITLIVNDGQVDSAPDTVQITITDFTLGISPASVTVKAGQAATYTVTITPQFGSFSNSVSLACSLPPALTLASCSLSPSAVTPGGNPATSTLTVSTTVSSAFLLPPVRQHGNAPLYAFWFGLPGLALLGVGLMRRESRKRTLCFYLSLALLLAFLAFQAACGGGGQPALQPAPRPGTPPALITLRSRPRPGRSNDPLLRRLQCSETWGNRRTGPVGSYSFKSPDLYTMRVPKVCSFGAGQRGRREHEESGTSSRFPSHAFGRLLVTQAEAGLSL